MNDDSEKQTMDYVRKILVFEEGYRTEVYPSYEGGTDTVGIGHKLTPKEAKEWPRGKHVPREQIERWYSSDVDAAILGARKWLGDSTYNRLGPLRKALAICMAYQMGALKLSKWTQTAEHIHRGEWEDVKQHILSSLWAKQTPKRARRMAQMWLENKLVEEYL